MLTTARFATRTLRAMRTLRVICARTAPTNSSTTSDHQHLPSHPQSTRVFEKTDDFSMRTIHCIPRRLVTQTSLDQSTSDIIVWDLEDSIPPTEKQEARTLYANALKTLSIPEASRIFIRINEVSEASPNWELDLSNLLHNSVKGFIIPKVEDPQAVENVDKRLGQLEKQFGFLHGQFCLVAIIESAKGTLRANEICSSSTRLKALSIGNHDLAADLRCDVDHETISICYKRILKAARAHGKVAGGGATTRLDSHAGFIKMAQNWKKMGLQGMVCLTKTQVDMARQIFT